MATQILYGRTIKKEISFADFKETINLTNYLKKICRSNFEDETFMEDEEEITYPVITVDKTALLLMTLTDNEKALREKLITIRGAENKTELIDNLKDLALLKDLIIKMLLQDCPNSEKRLALI